ncbi:branched-chain amino acid ABC transporter, permease protein [Bifidobacterium gallicum DSM 20093 = LMG 11596]|nr:branched-chain amino acid ABC transporter, permease protein [Bifidobacterium gallicum DSM 20093 = LMG 11596]
MMIALLASLVALVAFSPMQAHAAEAVDKCNPTAEVGCVNGILQTSDKKPIGGVEVTLSGAEKATTTTAADGSWAFAVNADGKYTVTIPKAAMQDNGLKTDSATVEVKKNDFGKQRAVVRFDEASKSAGSSAKSNSSGSSSSSSSSDSATGPSGSNFTKRFWQQLYSGILFGLMLALMSVGMNLIYGTTGLSSFSHGEQVTLGGLMAYLGAQVMHMPIWLAAVFAIVIGALTGFIEDVLIWGPLRKKRIGPLQQMIVTIGLSMALQYLFQCFFGGDIKGITKSIPEAIQIGPITTNAPSLLAAAIAIIVIAGVTFFLYRTRLGRATRAVSDNSALAAASGINVNRVVRVVWTLACGLAALSGVLMGIYLNGISWNTGATLLMLMFAAVTLGGLGTANGALVGSLVIGIVADMSSLFIPSDMRYASALAILIIVLLIRPQGIFGKQQRIG